MMQATTFTVGLMEGKSCRCTLLVYLFATNDVLFATELINLLRLSPSLSDTSRRFQHKAKAGEIDEALAEDFIFAMPLSQSN